MKWLLLLSHTRLTNLISIFNKYFHLHICKFGRNLHLPLLHHFYTKLYFSPSKHETLGQRWFTVGPTVNQRWPNVSCLLGIVRIENHSWHLYDYVTKYWNGCIRDCDTGVAANGSGFDRQAKLISEYFVCCTLHNMAPNTQQRTKWMFGLQEPGKFNNWYTVVPWYLRSAGVLMGSEHSLEASTIANIPHAKSVHHHFVILCIWMVVIFSE